MGESIDGLDAHATSVTPVSTTVSLGLQAICDSIHNLQCYGQDLQDVGKVSSHTQCCEACQSNAACKAWTWNWKYGGNCYLKSGCDDRRTDSDAYHSGIGSSPSPGPSPSPPTPSGSTPFTSLGCHAGVAAGSSSIWSAGGGKWQSCN